MKKTSENALLIAPLVVAALYTAAQMAANVASVRLVTIASYAVDGGTFIYPLTFTLRDLLHKTAGARAARALIVTAALANLLMVGLFWFVARQPADPNAVGAAQTAAFAEVLLPGIRIVLASIIAQVVAELLDTEVYRLWIERVTRRYQWLRVLVSNSISIPIDTLIFCWLAFGGVQPTSVVWSIILVNILVKGVTTLITLPTIYLVRERTANA